MATVLNHSEPAGLLSSDAQFGIWVRCGSYRGGGIGSDESQLSSGGILIVHVGAPIRFIAVGNVRFRLEERVDESIVNWLTTRAQRVSIVADNG